MLIHEDLCDQTADLMLRGVSRELTDQHLQEVADCHFSQALVSGFPDLNVESALLDLIVVFKGNDWLQISCIQRDLLLNDSSEALVLNNMAPQIYHELTLSVMEEVEAESFLG